MRRQKRIKEGGREQEGLLKEDAYVGRVEHGHRKMRVWQNIDKLDILVQKILKKIPKHEFKLRSQIDNASDSTGANFVEGYYSGSLAEYIRFCRYSKRSLAELQERVRRTFRKGYIEEGEFNEFDDLAIKTNVLIRPFTAIIG